MMGHHEATSALRAAANECPWHKMCTHIDSRLSHTSLKPPRRRIIARRTCMNQSSHPNNGRAVARGGTIEYGLRGGATVATARPYRAPKPQPVDRPLQT